MSLPINILMAQVSPMVGNVNANCEKIINIINTNKHKHDLIVFPELALTGYLLEDMLLRGDLYIKTNLALEKIRLSCDNTCHIVLGHPQKKANKIYNQATIFANNIVIATYSKQKLPNYGVFDEYRYFTPGTKQFPIFTIKNWKIKLCICEDLWQSEPKDFITQEKFDILLSINASPFSAIKLKNRLSLCKRYTKLGVSVIYVNQVGGQDELIFDGASFALNYNGKIIAKSLQFSEQLQTISIDKTTTQGLIYPTLTSSAAIYQAIVLGLKDYVHKNNFTNVVLGLSGGIDSALCLAIAVDAFGPKNVTAILLPSQYTADISNEDALQMANNLGVKNYKLAIHENYELLLTSVEKLVTHPTELTKQNLQARIRGILLMAISNTTNAMLICTSNKSETAVGYGTLYGDMIGGYAPIKDLFKTLVYKLAKYRNKVSPIIPLRIITRSPTAELAANQKDEDNLPKYAILDVILKLYIEKNLTAQQIISKGFDKELVATVIKLIKNSEHKRKQAPLGPKISTRSLGKDWRYPISAD